MRSMFLPAAAGKLSIFHFAANFTDAYTFWGAALGGCFLTMASHGTDQLMVQRLLSARNLRDSRLALLSSGLVILLQFSLFLAIGTGLYYFYGGSAGLEPDHVFPTFIVSQMPPVAARPDYRGDSCRSHVEPERVDQLA